MKAIILVGGEGTRLRPLTHTTVKAMIPVLNRPFIEYALRYLVSHKITEVILALGYKPDCITDYFGDTTEFGAKLVYSVETTPMGTAGAVKNAEKYLNSTFVAMNGDIFTDLNLSQMLEFHTNKGAMATIALTSVEDPTRFGVVETDVENRVTRFVEKPRPGLASSNMINAGIYVLEREVLDFIPANQRCMFEHDVFPALLAQGEPVFAYTTDAYWIDTGTPQQYLQLNGDLMLGKSIQSTFKKGDIRIEKGSLLHQQTKLTGPVLVDKDCVIGKGVKLKGPVIVGRGCRIEAGAILENSILWQNVSVGRKAVLKDCIVASNSCIEHSACHQYATIAQANK